jgi:hypothetical protein
MSVRVEDLHRLDRDDLAQVMRTGHPVDPAALDDTVYRGTSLGLGRLIERLTWRTFAKTFHRDPETGRLRGWNVRCEQQGDADPLVYLQKRGAPFTFGHYRVVPLRDEGTGRGLPGGLLLDYGGAGNARLDPASRARDPVVAVNPGDPSLLLGWMYMDLGVAFPRTPSFFTLQRERALDHTAAP